MPGPSICAAAPKVRPRNTVAATGNARMMISPSPRGLFLVRKRGKVKFLSAGKSDHNTASFRNHTRIWLVQAGSGRPVPDKPEPMARYDFRTPRLFVDAALAEGGEVALEREQANYLVNVLRLKPGADVLIFNGRDGEWRAQLAASGKKGAKLGILARTREQTAAPDLHYLFAPLKHARLDYMVQKAVEMGASRLLPILTRHTQAERVNLARMRANAIEAAEQCGILDIAEIAEPVKFDAFVRGWAADRVLIFCDEDAEVKDPVAALSAGTRRRHRGTARRSAC